MNTVNAENIDRPDIVVDLERLTTNCNGNLKIVVELLHHLYKESGPKWIAAIEKGIRDGDSESVQEVCHGMKGASSTIFAWRISNLALELEYLARDKAIRKLSDRMGELKEAFIEIEEWVKAHPGFS